MYVDDHAIDSRGRFVAVSVHFELASILACFEPLISRERTTD